MQTVPVEHLLIVIDGMIPYFNCPQRCICKKLTAFVISKIPELAVDVKNRFKPSDIILDEDKISVQYGRVFSFVFYFSLARFNVIAVLWPLVYLDLTRKRPRLFLDKIARHGALALYREIFRFKGIFGKPSDKMASSGSM